MNETLTVLFNRRSCRKYKPEQIKDEELDIILKAGTYAPSASNKQSAIIVAIQDPEEIKKLSKMNADVMSSSSDPFYGAPTVVVVLGDKERSARRDDANLVASNIMHAAESIGINSCYIFRAREVFDTDQGKALLKKWGIQGDYEGICNIILGYGLPEGIKPAAKRKDGYITIIK